MSMAAGVLAVDNAFADQGEGDANRTEDEGFAPAESIEEEDDEDEVCRC